MPFVDTYLDGHVPGVGCIATPRFKTTIQVNASGKERRNQEWEHPLHMFILPEATRQWSVVQSLDKHFRIMRGPYMSWPWRNPFDFASCDLTRPNTVPTPTMTDQTIGTGDGFTDSFQLTKTYTVGSETYSRDIHLPVLSSVLIAIDGVLVPDTDYTVSRPGGVVTFNTPPSVSDDVISAGFLFDHEVRFESDDQLESIMRATRQAGFADLTLVEVRPC